MRVIRKLSRFLIKLPKYNKKMVKIRLFAASCLKSLRTFVRHDMYIIVVRVYSKRAAVYLYWHVWVKHTYTYMYTACQILVLQLISAITCHLFPPLYIAYTFTFLVFTGERQMQVGVFMRLCNLVPYVNLIFRMLFIKCLHAI